MNDTIVEEESRVEEVTLLTYDSSREKEGISILPNLSTIEATSILHLPTQA